jgi:hypothetical protein
MFVGVTAEGTAIDVITFDRPCDRAVTDVEVALERRLVQHVL